MALENFISDKTWLWYCFNADSFFPNQWTEEPKKRSSDHLAGFPSSKSCLSVSTDWVEYSHNTASIGSLNLFSLPSLWLKLWCLGSLLSDLTLRNIQHTASDISPIWKDKEMMWKIGFDTQAHQLARLLATKAHPAGSLHHLQYSLPPAPEALNCKPRGTAVSDAKKSWRNCYGTEAIPHTLTF